MSGFATDLADRLHETMSRHAAKDDVGGVAWLAARDDDVIAGSAGVLTRSTDHRARRDSIFRISSVTKPIVAVAALTLVDECVLRLDDPAHLVVPELRDRRVLVDPLGPIDGPTVPAERPISIRDVLTLQLGIGMDMARPFPQPMLDALARLGLGAGPPAPAGPPPPDEWMARFATLPLQHQPGTRWLYNVGSEVLGVMVARAAGAPLGVVLRERVFEPLGMTDTDFWTPRIDRLGSCHEIDPDTGATSIYDPPDGQWSTPPAFPSGAAGLVSTVDDLHRFARMLLDRGLLPDGRQLLSPATVTAMTTDQLGLAPGTPGISPDGSDAVGWGFGVGVQLRRTGIDHGPGSYGWEGGLGSSWWNDPGSRTIGVVLTTDAFGGPDHPPTAISDFWTLVATSTLE